MKTSVTRIMMSFALMGCLIFSASDAMAQGRSRSQGGSTSSRSQSAAVSRSSSSSAPTVSRTSSSSTGSRSTAAPQVNRSSSSSSTSSSRSVTTTPQVSRSTSSSTSSSSRSTTTTSQVNRGSSTDNKGTATRPSTSGTTGSRVSTGSTGRSTTGGSSDLNQSRDRRDLTVKDASTLNKSDLTKGTGTSSSDNKSTRPTSKPGNGGNVGNGNNGGKPGNGGNMGNGNNGGKPGDGGKPGNGGKPGDGGNGRPNSNRPNGNHGNNGNHGYNHDNHFDYSNHPYRNDFHNNYINHRWSWSRPLPPPARRYRPAPIVWYRPVIPVGWYPYASAPVIDRILGITFGTLFDSSLDYLYYNGYEIDGYADHVIYLRNVPLLNLAWEDVMLCYDDYDRLVNAQFIFQTARNDHRRYDRVYNSLCRIYGQPIDSGNNGLSWYGGNSTGWVTLSAFENMGHYYTTLSIGY